MLHSQVALWVLKWTALAEYQVSVHPTEAVNGGSLDLVPQERLS